MMDNKLDYLEAQDRANKLLEVYNIEDVLAVSGADEGNILAFLIYWDQLDVPEDIINGS